MSGEVIVARSMSLDGFIADPGDNAQEWIFDCVEAPTRRIADGDAPAT